MMESLGSITYAFLKNLRFEKDPSDVSAKGTFYDVCTEFRVSHIISCKSSNPRCPLSDKENLTKVKLILFIDVLPSLG